MNAREPLGVSLARAASQGGEEPITAICVPSTDNVNANFAMALAQLLYYCGIRRRRTVLVNNKGSNIAGNRNNGVREAQRLGACKLLFLDADMTFPMNVVERLEGWGKPIVGATYPQRSGLHKNLARPKANVPVDLEGRKVIEVDRLPTGCLLIDMAVFAKLKRPYFRFTFREEDELAGVTPDLGGEDYDFCDRAVAAGIPVHLDVDLSFNIVHWGESGWRLDTDLCGKAPDQPDAHLVQIENA